MQKTIRVLSMIALSACLPASSQDTRHVVEPMIPQICASLPAKLMAVDGKVPEKVEQQLDTARIQEAIDHCIAGRAVELRMEGDNNAFLSGPLELRPSVTLLMARGATLFATRNPRAYDLQAGSCGVVNQAGRGCKPLILASKAPHSGVMGEGAIDGQGGERLLTENKSWWDLAHQAKVEDAKQNCPRLLVVDSSDDFTLYGIELRNSPNFHVIVNKTNGFTAWGVRVYAPANARNTDGIDPASSTNVTITRSYISVGDDNVAIKAGNAGSASNITIADNHFYSGHGMSIGSETNGGVSAVRVSGLTIDGADNGIRIKSDSSRGGLVHDVTYENVCIRKVKNPITMSPFYSEATGTLIPTYSDIRLRNVRVLSPGAVTLLGIDAHHPLELRMDNVALESVPMTKVQAAHAHVSVGPGPVNFKLQGDDVTVAISKEQPVTFATSACDNALISFPDSPVVRPRQKTMKDEEPGPLHPHVGTARLVTVAADGSADYKTVQEGVDALTAEGGTVQIKPGVYREVLYVAKPHVHLHGLADDAEKTVIVYSNSASSSGGTFFSATAFITGDDFYAENLTFQNDYSKRNEMRPQGSQAVALSIRGDRAIFRNVRFLGAQDTLFAASRSCESDSGPCAPTRQYFQQCYIEGNVDFIFGDAKAVFDHCHIHAIAHEQVFITAQSKRYPEQQSGYVFNHCTITADSGVKRLFLGRPWRAYATVIFLDSQMNANLEPAGWAEWHPGETHRLESSFYAEHDSAGPGSNPAQRDSHSKQLSTTEAKEYAAKSFLAGSDGWNPELVQ
jgi:polygalacturonase